MKWRVAGAALVLALAARLCFLFITYASDSSRSARPQIETGALLFVVAGLVLRAATAREPSPSTEAEKRPRIVALGLLSVAALALYFPVLRVGYLSDDFILAQHASAWQFGAVAPQLFRPVPLLVWAIVLHAGGGAVALHLLNLLLHAVNAFLTIRVVSAWAQGRWWSLSAGLLMLTSPLAPEAVAWDAGIFDVMSTTFVLLAVLVARRYESSSAIAIRLTLAALCAAALLSKETAAITPVLIALDAWVRGMRSKKLFVDLLAITAVLGVVAFVRLQSQAAAPSVVTKYRLQRVAFDSFGTLANPWHAELFQSPLSLSLFSGLSIVVLLGLFFLISGSTRTTKTIVGCALWVLVSLIPVLPLFFVSPSLEGSRYLYLATIGWAGGLVVMASDVVRHRTTFVVPLVIVGAISIVIAAYATRVHLQPWLEAKGSRDLVLSSALRNNAMRECEVLSVRNLPQTTKGAYVFANGAREAFAGIGLNVYVRDTDGRCAFTWDGATGQFVHATGKP